MLDMNKRNRTRVIGREERAEITALYARLSRDDETDRESNSIANQRNILTGYAAEHGFADTRFYADDGVSGTTFDRPAFNRMIEDIEKGEISAVIVKDLSRLGRDHIMVGYYTRMYFPDNRVRFIAIYDSVDSDNGENEFAPFKNIINEWYARDTSRKVRAVLSSKGLSGGILNSIPVYGYKNDPDNKNHWLVDEKAASTVRLIFRLYNEGMGLCRISRYLMNHNIPTPSEYRSMEGLPTRRPTDKTSCMWSSVTVGNILRCREYCGDIVNFKTRRESYKSRRIIHNPEEKTVVFHNVNTPIIPADQWEQVNSLYNRKSVPRLNCPPDIYSGLIFCADCGRRLSVVHGSGRNPTYYLCNTYKNNSKKCTAHYVRKKLISERLIEAVNRAINACHGSSEFSAAVKKQIADSINKEQAAIIGEIGELSERSGQYDTLIRQLYEDRAFGRISEERYKTLMCGYEGEQQEISSRLAAYRNIETVYKERLRQADELIQMLAVYNPISDITPAVLSELIEKIVVHRVEFTEGGKSQRIDIYFKGAVLL